MSATVDKHGIVAVLALATVMVGCGSQSFSVSQAPTESFGRFERIRIPVFANNVKNMTPEDQEGLNAFAAELSRMLEKRFAQKEIFASPTGRCMVVKGAIVSYDPGSRTARYLIGFGAGTGTIVADVKFTNEEGKVLAAGTATGTISGGFFGGSIDDAVSRVASAIERFVEENYQQPVREERQAVENIPKPSKEDATPPQPAVRIVKTWNGKSKDGKQGIFCDLENGGEKMIAKVIVVANYLDAQGNVLFSERVAFKNLKPGEKRSGGFVVSERGQAKIVLAVAGVEE